MRKALNFLNFFSPALSAPFAVQLFLFGSRLSGLGFLKKFRPCGKSRCFFDVIGYFALTVQFRGGGNRERRYPILFRKERLLLINTPFSSTLSHVIHL
jgi:hypothetical protein